MKAFYFRAILDSKLSIFTFRIELRTFRYKLHICNLQVRVNICSMEPALLAETCLPKYSSVSVNISTLVDVVDQP